MTIYIDYPPIKECKNIYETYGEICVKCNKCGRFDKGGDKNPIRSDIKLIEQGNDGFPPLWRYPKEFATYFENKWCRRDRKISEGGALTEILPECWQRNELDYVRWWVEGRNY